MRMENLLEFPFDMYQRYKDIQVIVKELFGAKKVSVLDVGGENNLICKFLPDAETYYINHRDEKASNFIRGSGVYLPLKDSIFDLVVTADTLEHIKPKDREQFITELLRASKNYVIIIAPFDNGVTPLADKFLYEVIIQFLGIEHPSLKEHITNGLPKLQEVTATLKKLKAEHIFFPSGNIHNWLAMMLIKHYLLSIPYSEQLHKYVDSFYNQNFYEIDHSSPSYRKVFVIAKKGSKLDFIKKVFDITKSETTDVIMLKFFDTISVLSNISMVKQLRVKEKRIQDVENVLGEKEDLIIKQSDHFQNLEKVLEDREKYIADVETVLKEKEGLIIKQSDHFQNLEKVLEDREKYIVDVETVLKEKEGLIIKQSDHTQNLEKVLEDREKLLTDIESVLKEKECLIIKQTDHIQNLENAFGEKKKQIADIENVLNQIYKSKLFRIYNKVAKIKRTE